MPLTMATPGEVNLIKKVGGKAETRLFLENLGLECNCGNQGRPGSGKPRYGRQNYGVNGSSCR